MKNKLYYFWLSLEYQIRKRLWETAGALHMNVCHGFQGPCLRRGKRRRQNTRYENHEDNYVVQCDCCFEATEEVWAERWAEYYGGLM